MLRVLRATIPLFLLVTGASCQFDATVPSDGEQLPSIACDTNSDCPTDWICQPTLGRCMPERRIDGEGPALDGRPSLSPGAGGQGQVFRLSFQVTEVLGDNPEVRLDTGDGEVSFAIDLLASDPIRLSYGYTYTASGDEQEGVRLISIDLVDSWGNATADLNGGSLLLDFTGPRVVNHNMQPSHASRSTVHLELELNEPVPMPPVVQLASTGTPPLYLDWVAEAASDSATHRFSFTPDGSEAEGVYAVLVSAEDAAGNQSQGEEIDKLTLDFTAPAASSLRVLPTAAPAGQRVLVEVELTEPLESHGALIAVPASGGVQHTYGDAGAASTLLRFDHTVQVGEEGRYLLQLEALEDLAGNRVETLSVGEVVYDTTAPGLLGYQQSHQSLLADDTLQVSFSTTESLGAEPAVTFGGIPLQRVGSDVAPYLFELAVGPTSLVGPHMVQVRLRDEVGNEAVLQPGTADVDAVVPQLLDIVFTPPAARLNITAILTVTANEPLAESPTLRWALPTGDPGFVYLGVSGLGHQYGLEVTPSVSQGIYEVVEVTLRDVAGNSAVVDATAFFAVFGIDNQPPVIGAVSTDAETYSAVAGYNVITTSFDVDTSLDSGDSRLEVLLGAEPFVCGTFQASSPSYTCVYTVNGLEPEGLNIVSVRAVDAAGNESSASAPVRLDFSPPALVPGTAELLLQPPSGCPMTSVSSWTDGATARVVLVLDEPTGAIPLVLTSAPEVIVFQHRTGATTSYSFEKTLNGEASIQGQHALEAAVVDLVGNTDTLDLAVTPQLVVDTVAPTMLVDQASVSYLRSPTGNSAVEDLGGFTIPAGPYYALAPPDPLSAQPSLAAGTFALDEGSPALVQVWGDASQGSLLGATLANGDGTWPRLRLANVNTPRIYVSGLDSACNASAPVGIDAAEWVATAAPPAYGPSPNQLESSGRSSNALVRAPGSTAPVGAEIWGADGTAALALAQPAWLKRASSLARPAARNSHAMAFDRARGRVVLFGGSSSQQDTWEWDGYAWEDRTPPGASPPGRRHGAMTYDSVRNRVLLFGGSGDSGSLNDTWEWDGESWVDKTPSSGNPPTRSQHAMAFDSRRGRAVMFGGLRSGTRFSDTWEWDGQVWTPITPASLRPSGRFGPSMTFDSVRERVVLFGGYDGAVKQDLWEWDGQSWVNRTPATGNPVARFYHQIVFDSLRERVVLFSGSASAGGLQQDTWEWDGQSWIPRTPATGSPAARYTFGMAYDSVRGRTVVFSGYLNPGSPDDTWEWDGERWLEVTPAPEQPTARHNHAMTYDSDRDRVVLFGGSGHTAGRVDDTWEWNGQSWTNVTPESGSPPARDNHAMAYDKRNQRVVMFGGYTTTRKQDTWLWDGQDWTDATPASGNPPARSYHAMAYDEGSQRVVLFGGSISGGRQDTWEWDGQGWNEITPASGNPPTRYSHGLSYDSVGMHLVLFGGEGSSDAMQDTWHWVGGGWQEQTQAVDKPRRRSRFAMGFDRRRGHTVVFGGGDRNASFEEHDTWEWNGQRWSERLPQSSLPFPRYDQAMAYHDGIDRMVLFGGWAGSSGAQQDTWEYDSGAEGYPLFQLKVDFNQAGLEPEDLTGLRVRAHCGGSFSPFGAGDTGATLMGWASGGTRLPSGSWQPLASNSAEAALSPPHLVAPPAALIEWSASSVEEARSYLRERERSLSFQCRPSGVSGSGEARVAIDFIEVRVRYQ